MYRSGILFGAVSLALIAFTPSAGATTILTYPLDFNNCSGTGGCGTAPYGAVTLNQISPTEVMVTETLDNGNEFVNTGAGEAIEFNITSGLIITISNVSTGFTAGSGAPSNPPSTSTIGGYQYFVECTACGSGGSNPQPGPLSFDVSVSTGSISVNDFIANSKGFFFASDILGNGNTGNVAADGGGAIIQSIPEPVSLGLTGAGLGLLGLFRIRRRNS